VSDIAGIVLHKLLQSPEDSIEIWPKLKLQFFNSDYSQLYVSISKHYNKYHKLPTFSDLKIITRDEAMLQKVISLELLPVSDDIDNLIAVEALLDQYTQEETLEQLSDFVDDLPHLDSSEVKENLGQILLDIEEKTETSEEIFLMNDILILDADEQHRKISLGLNNNLDALTGGTPLSELIMIGGHRGSGKTVAACNIAVNQYLQGDVGLFFSIEMRYREIFNRFISILSGVKNSNLTKQDCSQEDFLKLAKVRSNMFCEGESNYNDYLDHKNYEKFEIELLREKVLKPDNQLIIVDNQMLTLADIDVNIHKAKNKFGDKLKTVIVDYVNQIYTPDIYDWKSQIRLSKELKNLARKHDVVMVTPYQTDTSGEARFAKGLLDAADVAATLEANDDGYISFTSTKTRNIAPFQFNAPVDWETFAMSSKDAIVAEKTKDGEKSEDLEF